MNKNPCVDFMIAGAQKSGTTALAHFCSQHPEIEMASPKEPHIFDSPDFDPELIGEKYQSFFSGDIDNTPDSQGRYLGEATPIYMFLPEIPERLHRYNPNLKLIILLRHPVARAVSHYCMERNRGNEGRAFVAALCAEPFRVFRDKKNRELDSSLRAHSYMQRGDYSQQINRLLKWFSSDQMLLLDFDDLNNNHTECIARVFGFLGVDRNFRIEARHVFATPDRDVPKWAIRLFNLVFFRRISLYRKLISGA